MAGHLFIISAPSGSGKSTLVNQLRSLVTDLDFSISYTTRAPRGSEQDGREYHFTTREAFEQTMSRGEFLEHAEVYGNLYGTALQSLVSARENGRDLILDIDIQGAAQVLERMPEAISIFVLPPSPSVLQERLRNRSHAEGVTSQEVLQRRLDKARLEIECVWDYKYALVNDALEEAITDLKGIVLAERDQDLKFESAQEKEFRAIALACRTSQPSPRLEHALESFGVSIAQRPSGD